jgi:hypothetical protein
MSAWLIAALERLPRRGRRTVAAVVALLLLGASLAALILAPAPGGGVRPLRPGPRAPAQKTPPRPSPPSVLPPVPATQLRLAQDAAQQFLRSYLSFAYGRVRALVLTPVTPALRHQLVRERGRLTPAERRRDPRVVWLRVVRIMPDFVAATAAVTDGGIATYPLRFTLKRSAGRWSVSGLQAG